MRSSIGRRSTTSCSATAGASTAWTPTLVRSCYHPDATDEHGSFAGTVDEYLTWVFRLLSKLRQHAAPAGQPPRRLRRRSRRSRGWRSSESYGVSVHQTANGPASKNLVVGFRFVDRFERRDGEWRIAARAATTEWTRVLDPAGAWPTPAASAHRPARPHRRALHLPRRPLISCRLAAIDASLDRGAVGAADEQPAARRRRRRSRARSRRRRRSSWAE